MVLKCKGACNLCGDKNCPDHVHCHSWKQRGFCRPEGPYYSYMKAYCPATCELCGCVPEPNNDPSCAFLAKAGYCNPKHRFYGYMMNNCQHSCGFCPGSSKTEPTTSTTSASSTTAELSTTPSPSTTGVPSTTSSLSTTSAPSTTSSPSTTGAPSTKSGLSTTGAPSTTSDVSTTGEQSTSSSNTTAALTAEVNACLKVHNERRALHGASPLVWDDTLREHAQAWADHLAETGKIRHDPNRDEEGENIAWFKGYRTAGCEDALMEWYDREEPKYDYRNPGFSPETGQFTQVVWKDTRAVGVAQASRGSGFSKQIFIVARYSPSGNFILRRFKENVVERRNQPNTTPSWKRSSTRGSKKTPDTLVTRKAVTSIQPSAPTTSLTVEVYHLEALHLLKTTI
ncbi:uncharacterized protein [Pocillopora verrucosa]|uniref:uncharacterized protein n=1 Tax=Pocillopora verrucosa TaxID=203993 RepID=UPI003341EC51